MVIHGLMICPRKQIEQEKDLPEGMEYVSYSDTLKEEWIHLELEYENFTSSQKALKFIEQEDMNRFVFVKDKEGKLVGSAGLFFGNQFGMKRIQLGKVATSNSDIAKAMITKLVLQYDSIPSKYPVYVEVTENELEWIKIFANLDFTPYLGFYESHTDKQSERDWTLLTKKLKENSIS